MLDGDEDDGLDSGEEEQEDGDATISNSQHQ